MAAEWINEFLSEAKKLIGRLGDVRLEYMPLFINAFFADENVQAMNTEQRGAYMMLLMRGWQQSPPASVPDDDAKLANWAGLAKARWMKMRDVVITPFDVGEDGRLYQKRLAREWIKSAKVYMARKRGAEVTNEARKANTERNGERDAEHVVERNAERDAERSSSERNNPTQPNPTQPGLPNPDYPDSPERTGSPGKPGSEGNGRASHAAGSGSGVNGSVGSGGSGRAGNAVSQRDFDHLARSSQVMSRLTEIGVNAAVIDQIKGSPRVTVQVINREWSESQTGGDPKAVLATRLRKIAGVR